MWIYGAMYPRFVPLTPLESFYFEGQEEEGEDGEDGEDRESRV